MPLNRTPPTEDSVKMSTNLDNKTDGNPRGRLGSVTRKWNQIAVLMNNPSEENRQAISVAHQELSDRVCSFHDSCYHYKLQQQGDSEEAKLKFEEWKTERAEVISAYLQKTSKWIEEYPVTAIKTVDVDDSASNLGLSKLSKKSQHSTTSSLRFQLLKERAQLKAEEALSKEEADLELKMLEAKKKLEFKKRQVLIQKLDEVINETHSVASGSRADRTSRQEKGKDKENMERKSNVVPLHAQQSLLSGIQLSHQGLGALDTLQMFAKAQERLTLPKNEPDKFDGSDCTKFVKFLSDFDEHIAKKCTTDQEKYAYLQKYTSGRPLTLVLSCQYKDDASDRYNSARKRLKEQYGDKYKIAQHYYKAIEEFPSIKSEDGQGLEDLATLMADCKAVIDGMGPLKHLSSPKEMLGILMKLPFKLREGWRRKVFKWRKNNYEPTFSDLTDYVNEEAMICNTAMYETLKDEVSAKGKQSFGGAKKKTFSVKSSSVDRKPNGTYTCTYCHKLGHSLVQCFEFIKKPIMDRLSFLREQKLCFGCLKIGHSKRTCKTRLKCSKCARFHPTCLHENSKSEEKKQVTAGDKGKVLETTTATELSSKEEGTCEKAASSKEQGACAKATCAASRGEANNSRILCTAVPVKVRCEQSGDYIETYLALDGWSTDSFMDAELLNKIGARCYNKNMTISTMGAPNCLISVKAVKNLEVQSLSGDYSVEIPEIFAKSQWPFTLEDSPKPQDASNWQHLKNIPFEFISEKIGILVGMGMSELMEPLNIISGKPGQPYATLHRLGWAINGPVGSIVSKRSMCHRTFVEADKHISTEEKLEELYSREFRDHEPGVIGPSVQDMQWEHKVKSSIKKTCDNHYEIGLPFKDSDLILPSNYFQIYGRLQSKVKSLKRNPEVYKEYKDFMKTMLENGYMEQVPADQWEGIPGRVWFLTHFEVRHKQKGKIRIVFDCSLKCRGVSLNDVLHQGPDLANSLLGVLLKFRQEKVAFMADIHKMFYQVRVPEKDRDFLRLLWFPDGAVDQKPQQYRLTVHVFGAVSSPSCSNYALRKVVDDNPEATEEAKCTIRRNFYVDDLVKSVPTHQEASHLIKEVTSLLEKGGFKLTGFVSNSREVLAQVPPERLTKNLECIDLTSDQDLPYDRALGVVWKTQEDFLSFKIQKGPESLTKRGILSSIFSVYDPLGLVIPVILMGRSIFQEACRMKLPWDETLPQYLKEKWSSWWNEMDLLNHYSIPRCYKGPIKCAKKTELHIFADGSEIGYAAVAYIRLVDANSIHCSLVMSRAHLVPSSNSALKTIPRIELSAAKLGVELMQTLKRDLDYEFTRIVLWSDSTTVLRYIDSETGRFQRYVSNRISFIRSATTSEQWRYVPGDLNPADLASRGCTAAAFTQNNMWKFGPEFLWKLEDQWPKLDLIPTVESDSLEYKKGEAALNLGTIPRRLIGSSPTQMLLESSSSWLITKKRIGWWLRIKFGLHSQVWTKGDLLPSEIKRAEQSILVYVQKESFENQLSCLHQKKCLPAGDKLLKLSPFVDLKGILRVGGRQRNSAADYETRHPVILPKVSYIVKLIVSDCHENSGHLGRETILGNLRMKYWIIGANSLVRKILRECLICRKNQAKVGEQIMADLPMDRLAVGEPPFSRTGVDCFGPIEIKRGRGTEKRYGLAFTCLTSRAIHLEVVFSLSSDSFICAFRRFTSRRGTPKCIRSDNGTNFVGANRELIEAVKKCENTHLVSWCQQKGVEWKFNTPTASHQGGIWEREIRSIKKILNSMMKQQVLKLTDEALCTLLCEVENILNSRPLTALSDDPQDAEPLTPNHLLLVCSGNVFPLGLFSKDDLYVRQRWKQVQYLADLFWTRFRKEYLTLLQARQKWKNVRRSFEAGDLVLLSDQSLPRNCWSMGRILEVHAGRDGYVRTAKIKVGRHRSGKDLKIESAVLERPITKLVLLKTVEDLVS